MIRKYVEIFAEKMWVAFALQATHIVSAKNIRILYIESAKTVKEMTLNELVKLMMVWTTRPRIVWLKKVSYLELRFFSADCIVPYLQYVFRQIGLSSVDPDEMPQNVASHQGLHCLPLIRQNVLPKVVIFDIGHSSFKNLSGIKGDI